MAEPFDVIWRRDVTVSRQILAYDVTALLNEMSPKDVSRAKGTLNTSWEVRQRWGVFIEDGNICTLK